MSERVAGIPEAVEIDVQGVPLTLRVSDDPSGLRGQVFDGEEKIAGVQIYHQKDVARLIEAARRDRAVQHAVRRLTGR